MTKDGDPSDLCLASETYHRGVLLIVQTKEDTGRFCGLEHVLESDIYPDLPKLAECVGASLSLICDVKQVDSDSFYRLNSRKVRDRLAFVGHMMANALCKHICTIDSAVNSFGHPMSVQWTLCSASFCSDLTN